MADKAVQSKKYLAPPGILSFPALFEKNNHDKYQATQIWPAGTDLSVVEKAIDEACTLKWGADWAKTIGKKIKYPIHANTDGIKADTGDRYAGYEEDEGHYAAFRSTTLPNVICSKKDESGKWIRIGQSEIWDGCLTQVSFYALAGVNEGPYCSLRLQNIQLRQELPRLSGGSTPDPEDDGFADDAEVQAALA